MNTRTIDNYDCDSFYCFALIFWFLNNTHNNQIKRSTFNCDDFCRLFCSIHFPSPQQQSRHERTITAPFRDHFEPRFSCIVHTFFSSHVVFLFWFIPPYMICYSSIEIPIVLYSQNIHTYILAFKQKIHPLAQKAKNQSTTSRNKKIGTGKLCRDLRLSKHWSNK